MTTSGCRREGSDAHWSSHRSPVLAGKRTRTEAPRPAGDALMSSRTAEEAGAWGRKGRGWGILREGASASCVGPLCQLYVSTRRGQRLSRWMVEHCVCGGGGGDVVCR